MAKDTTKEGEEKIAPTEQKKIKDMTDKEKREALHLNKFNRKHWQKFGATVMLMFMCLAGFSQFSTNKSGRVYFTNMLPTTYSHAAHLVDSVTVPGGLLNYPGDLVEGYFNMNVPLDSNYGFTITLNGVAADTSTVLASGSIAYKLIMGAADTCCFLIMNGQTAHRTVYYHGFNLSNGFTIREAIKPSGGALGRKLTYPYLGSELLWFRQ